MNTGKIRCRLVEVSAASCWHVRSEMEEIWDELSLFEFQVSVFGC